MQPQIAEDKFWQRAIRASSWALQVVGDLKFVTEKLGIYQKSLWNIRERGAVERPFWRRSLKGAEPQWCGNSNFGPFFTQNGTLISFPTLLRVFATHCNHLFTSPTSPAPYERNLPTTSNRDGSGDKKRCRVGICETGELVEVGTWSESTQLTCYYTWQGTALPRDWNRLQLRTIKVIKFTDWFFGTPKSIGIGR